MDHGGIGASCATDGAAQRACAVSWSDNLIYASCGDSDTVRRCPRRGVGGPAWAAVGGVAASPLAKTK